jgi:hypothetical protein
MSEKQLRSSRSKDVMALLRAGLATELKETGEPRGRGRPLGSKNKKPAASGPTTRSAAAAAAAQELTEQLDRLAATGTATPAARTSRDAAASEPPRGRRESKGTTPASAPAPAPAGDPLDSDLEDPPPLTGGVLPFGNEDSDGDYERSEASSDDDDDVHKVRFIKPRRAADPIVRTVLATVATAGGARNWLATRARIEQPRNRHEAEQWALLIDLWLSDERLPVDAKPLEVAVRRLSGIVEFENTGSWETASAMELYKSSSLLTVEQLTFFNGVAKKNRVATAGASASAKYHRKSGTDASGGARGGRGARGRFRSARGRGTGAAGAAGN